MRSILKLSTLILFLITGYSLQAQSLGDLFNKDNISKVVNTVTGANKDVQLEGTWIYQGSAVEFESENLLMKAGGKAAAIAAETKLNEQLKKFGITTGSMTFTFNNDSTFTTTVAGKSLLGTYTYNAESKVLSLKYLKLMNMDAEVSYNVSSMDMLFNSDKLLKLIVFLSSKTSNSALKSISTLASKYDGMMLGFELKKQ